MVISKDIQFSVLRKPNSLSDTLHPNHILNNDIGILRVIHARILRVTTVPPTKIPTAYTSCLSNVLHPPHVQAFISTWPEPILPQDLLSLYPSTFGFPVSFIFLKL